MRVAALWWFLPAAAISFGGLGSSTTSYSKDIRPILEMRCVRCHSEGGMGPFSLQTYAQVRKRGDLVRQVSLTGQMPPTDAASDFGLLTPHQPLTAAELVAIQDWFRHGMAEGQETPPLSGVDRRNAAVSKHMAAYRVGKGQSIPPEGRTVRTVYRIPQPPGGISHIGGFAFQPDSPKAVRQVLLAVQKPGRPAPFTSAGVVPGTPVLAWSEGFLDWSGNVGALRIGQADQLWIQVRAVPTGKPEPASGLVVLSRSARADAISSRTIGNRTFVIDKDSQVVLQSQWRLDRDIDLVSLVPEARFTTEQVRLMVQEPEGSVRTVARVLTWDPVWPGAYNFARPIRLKKGAVLTYEAVINNTRHGHAAEDRPPRDVRFGPAATDELFWCHLNYIPR